MKFKLAQRLNAKAQMLLRIRFVSICFITLHETVSALPQGILRCEGFASERPAFPRRWVEELSWDVPGQLIEMLQIDQFDRPDTERSLRLTIMPFPESPQATKPVPFFVRCQAS
jgi:hypothetical protein